MLHVLCYRKCQANKKILQTQLGEFAGNITIILQSTAVAMETNQSEIFGAFINRNIASDIALVVVTIVSLI